MLCVRKIGKVRIDCVTDLRDVRKLRGSVRKLMRVLKL